MNDISSDMNDGTIFETELERDMDLPDKLLRGTIDVHVHAGPHLKSSPRRVDPVQAATQARDAGMRAIVYMDIFQISAGTAWIINRLMPDPNFITFGGIVLNSMFGGLNPRAVKQALEYGDGAKFVSLGAHCTWHLARQEGNLHNGKPTPFIEYEEDFIREEYSRAIRIPTDGTVSLELDQILSVLAEHPDCYLHSGHVSGEEAVSLVYLAERYGIKKVLVSHIARRNMDLDQCREAADHGAYLEAACADYLYPRGPQRFHYYVEPHYRNLCQFPPSKLGSTFADLKNEVDQIGAENYIICTDYGIRGGSTPVEGFRQFLGTLSDVGVSIPDIRRMSVSNPADLLGL